MLMPFSLPPSYTSSLPGYTSSIPSSNKGHNRKRKPTVDTSFGRGDDADKADLKSISSGHSSSTNHSSRSHHSSRSDTLKLTIQTGPGDDPSAKKTTRRAKCAPEFLEEIAKAGVPEGFETRAESQFKIVHGIEAEMLFDKFIREQEADHAPNGGSEKERSPAGDGHQYLSNPVVFAITFLDAGRKVVDYYMTWRGKMPRIRDRQERRLSFLDSEFRRIARSLDKRYRYASSVVSVAGSDSPAIEPTPIPDTTSQRKSPPSEVFVPPPAVAQQEEPQTPTNRERPVSATSSVISLPLLNMIRNVPFGNRLLLRVTNPDTASIMSDADTPTATPTAFRVLDTIIENAEPTTATAITESPTSIDPPLQPVQNHARTKAKEPHRSKSLKETFKRIDSISHRQSKEKKSNSDDRPSKRKHSSRRNKSEERNSEEHVSRKHSSKKRHRDSDDSDTDSDEASEFTIVLIDDKADKELSWHGLDRSDPVPTPRSTTALLNSPWTGPLVNANGIIFHSPPRQRQDDSDDESDDEEYEYDWSRNPPVIPVINASQQFASPAPPVPIPLSYVSSVASSVASVRGASVGAGGGGMTRPASVASYHTAYTYPGHRLTAGSSPYVPAWINPHQFTPDTPLMRLQTPVSYHSGNPY
ncbi:hypothetical protein AX17_000225 [Amanita inopinata Kibby_2008]|nr:hypothetical protein AX17_000225 [Amanita inopinata Kibby_2008]